MGQHLSDLVLGVDGGGSKTLLFVADREGSVIHAAIAHGSNPVDNADWRGEFAQLARGAAPYAGRIAAGVIGVGSYRESPTVDAKVSGTLTALFPFAIDIENDVYLAHDAAFLGEPGVLLLAGTGSMVVARGADGTLHRVGGWGHLFGDEGSAFWIGREALSLATRTLDGRANSHTLTAAIVAELVPAGSMGTVGILDWAARLSHPRSSIAALSRVVARCAENGDADALALIKRSADFLAEHVQSGRRVSGLADDGAWSLLGGLASNHLMRNQLVVRLGPLTSPKLPPCGGALWRAARKARWTIEPCWLDRVRSNIEAFSPSPPQGSNPK